MSSSVIYEQPLNERIRMFMRLDALLARLGQTLAQDNINNTHHAIITLVELVALTARMDIKQELVKELERLNSNLMGLRERPNADVNRINTLISQQRAWVDSILGLAGAMDQHTKENDLFNAIRQRLAVPGGTCAFDLPVYHHWLTRSSSERRQLIKHWASSFDLLKEPISSVLQLIRRSGESETQTAHQGFYDQSLDGQRPWQLVRIALPHGSPLYPEISAGRQRFNVRFLIAREDGQRACQTQEDVSFTLSCCAI